jgi:hypothetical protein
VNCIASLLQNGGFLSDTIASLISIFLSKGIFVTSLQIFRGTYSKKIAKKWKYL